MVFLASLANRPAGDVGEERRDILVRWVDQGVKCGAERRGNSRAEERMRSEAFA